MIHIAKPLLGVEEQEAVKEVLASGMLAQGKKVGELEHRFAELCGARHAVAVNSGTAAIHSSLAALGINKGDEVITVPFTFVATANPIIMQGAKPVFVDVKEDTFNIDTEKIEEKITDKTKAIVAVDLYGQVYDFDSVNAIADKHNLMIVEDACQAVNAELNGKKAGTFGSMAAFSFYATKNMITGEGGMITTDNAEYAELARRFRHHGQSEQTRYEYHDLGYNYRMMDLQAAIAIEQLKKIGGFTKKRIENAKVLTDGLAGIHGLQVPYVKPNAKHVFHQYTIKVDSDRRDKLVLYLKDKGVGTGIYYPKPLHLHRQFMKYGYKEGDFPVSEGLSKQVVSLPVHPALTEDDLNKIIKSIGDFFV